MKQNSGKFRLKYRARVNLCAGNKDENKGGFCVALVEHRIDGVVDKVKMAIDRLKAFEPPEGYYLAFSGGKDSQCIYHLAVEAGVKFDAHYNLTTVDPPELVYFIRDNYPDVIIDKPKQTMWKLIEKKGLPTRLKRWCCSELKEHGGEGRLCVTGVRWAESNQRRSRKPFEVFTKKKEDKMLFDDNDEDRRLFENCMQKGKRVINPIIDWQDEDVWELIHSRNLKYCKLYDEGHKRLGCIGCPIADKEKIKAFEKYPRYYENYLRALKKFMPGYLERRKAKGLVPRFTTAEEMMQWYVCGKGSKEIVCDGQIEFE
jgi:phosphoadenosine phosphosulfate reductase